LLNAFRGIDPVDDTTIDPLIDPLLDPAAVDPAVNPVAVPLLERLKVPVDAVAQVLQQRFFRDTYSDAVGSTGEPSDPADRNSSGRVDSFLYSESFKQGLAEALAGTSDRATEAKKVEKAFNAFNYFQDSYTTPSTQPAPVSLPSATAVIRAVDLQRGFIRA
jgi:hypothetical protein